MIGMNTRWPAAIVRMLAILILFPAALSVAAQSTPLLSHYDRMPAFYNPGALGTTDLIRIRGGVRLQWLGIDNAPVSVVGVADMPVRIGKKRLAVGLALQQESLGLYRNLQVGAMAGYHLRLLGGTLIPGIRIGLANEVFKGSEVFLPDDDDFHHGTDEAIPNTDVSGNTLDLGAGLYYLRGSWYAGMSMLHLNSPVVRFQTESGSVAGGTTDESGTIKNYEYRFDRTLYFMAGGNIPVKNTLFEVIPSLIVSSDFSDFNAIATAMVRYNKFLNAGLAYRYNDAVCLRLGVDFRNFYIGYSYEYPVSAIIKASSGSHEIIAGYSLKLDFSEKNKNKHKSIRLM